MAALLQKKDASFKLLPALSRFPNAKSNEFSIMSWNILIKDYHYKYYGYLEEEYKKWEYRLPLIHKTISNFNTDIICLQEAHLPSFQEDIGDYFNENGNYETVLNDSRKKKNKSNNKKGFVMTMTTPILFKRDKFKLIYQDFRSKASVALLQFIDDNDNDDEEMKKNNKSKQEESEEKKDDNKTLKKKKKNKNKNKENKLILDINKSFLWIINVHLEGDPSRPDTRFNQIKNILNRITNKTNESKLDINKVHVVFTGDFNAEKGEVVDDLLLNGYLSWDYRQSGYDDIDIVKSKNKTDYKHEWKFQSAYDNINDDINDNLQRKQIYTFYARNSFVCIDHIYYTSNNSKCMLCTETVPLWLSENKKLQCPNDKLVSDHLPIASMFKIDYENKKN